MTEEPVGRTEDTPQVVCLGILVADLWSRAVDEWPQRGRLSLVDEIGIGIGGCAANTGIGLRKLGARVSVVGAVGQDGLGDFVIGALQAAGIDSSHIVRVEQAGTSATIILIDNAGERTFIHHIGANACLKPEQIDLDLIRNTQILHYAGALLMPGFDGEPAASVLRQARKAGVTTCVDSAWDHTGRWMTVLEPVLREADIFLPSISEAEQLTGRSEPADIAAALLDLGIKTVALKMGESGCYVRTADVELKLPAYPVEVVDGTGAGDAFVAGFLLGTLRGWDLERTARLANAVGAMCCTATGTTRGVRGLDETIRFLEEHDDLDWQGIC